MERFKRALDAICVILTILGIFGSIIISAKYPDVYTHTPFVIVISIIIVGIIAGIVAYATNIYKKTAIVYCRIFCVLILLGGIFIFGNRAFITERSYAPPPPSGYFSAAVYKYLGQDKATYLDKLGKPTEINKDADIITWTYETNDGNQYKVSFKNNKAYLAGSFISYLKEYAAVSIKADMVAELKERGFKYYDTQKGSDYYKKGYLDCMLAHANTIDGGWVTMSFMSYNPY